jgi:capsular polysaccharide transport system permease protein
MINYNQQHRVSKGKKANKSLTMIVKHPTLSAVFILSILACIYWGIIASDRYVSVAHIVIQSTIDTNNVQTAMDLGTLLGGGGGAGNIIDQMLLRDRLLSVDMLEILDAKLDLRSHYSNKSRDVISRMWSKDVPREWFYRYYLSRVSIEFDLYSGVLVIQAEAFDSKTAHAILEAMIEEGGRAMNEMAHDLAREQVSSMEKQVTQVAQKFQQARMAVITYENKQGIVSPQDTATNFAKTIDQLHSQRASLQAQRNVSLGYLAPHAPGIVEIDLQLAAIQDQIKKEGARLTAPKGGNTLNSVIEEFERLELAAGFAQDIYKTALVALEKSRIEATRTIKKVSVLQSPTMPQYPLQPRRIYNIIVFILLTLLVSGVIHLLAAIIRDHKD